MSNYCKAELIIVFSHFKNNKPIGKEIYDEYEIYVLSDGYKKNHLKNNDKKRKKYVEEIIIKEKELLKSKTKEIYYQIDEKKNKELKEFFENQKLEQKIQKLNYSSLGNGLCYEKLNDKIIIYDKINSYKKVNEIKFKTNEIKNIIIIKI